jgi:hypothetical protein
MWRLRARLGAGAAEGREGEAGVAGGVCVWAEGGARRDFGLLGGVARLLSVGAGDVQERLETLLEERKALGEEVKRLEKAVRGSESSGDRRSLRPL